MGSSGINAGTWGENPGELGVSDTESRTDV